MRKIIFSTLGALLIGFAAKAQMEIKPTVGINLSDVNSTPDGTETEAKIGYQFGGSVMFGSRLYLSPGIYYYQQATQYVFDNPDGSTTAITSDEKIAGVKIPLLLGFRLMDPSSDPFFNARVFAGPSVLFNTKSSQSDGFLNDEIEWSKNTWGAQIGAGIDVAFLFLEVGYEFGLSDTYSGDNVAAESFKDVKHNTFVLNAGVRFAL